MTLSLNQAAVPAVPGAAPAPGLVVAEVTGPDELAGYVDCYGPSFGIPEDALPAQLAVERCRPDPPGTLVRFTGRVGGTLAGTAALLDRHGVAGLYVITVRPEFRRRGIGTALTAAALAAARDRGLTVATLHATPDGEPVYRRMGFTEVARYRHFSPPPLPG
jgi:ribosomal protein S18 acetylase RimI-like enzyme